MPSDPMSCPTRVVHTTSASTRFGEIRSYTVFACRLCGSGWSSSEPTKHSRSQPRCNAPSLTPRHCSPASSMSGPAVIIPMVGRRFALPLATKPPLLNAIRDDTRCRGECRARYLGTGAGMSALHGLALNPALSAELLEKLTVMPELQEVLSRRGAPPPEPTPLPIWVDEDGNEHFTLVCEDEVIHPDVFVAGSPATSPVALFRLASHEESAVRLALASREGLPLKACQRLVHDPDPEVARAAGANPSLPVSVMEEILSSTT